MLLAFERGLWAKGLTVAGLDEAGAGPLAGPVTAACVVLRPGVTDALLGVDDSKRLSPKRRTELAEIIRAHALACAVAHASVEEIDQLNIRAAGILAMERALDRVLQDVPRVEHLLIDARRLQRDIEQTDLIKGDARSLSIAAASILAKVARDELMQAADAQFPVYGFGKNKGYGTAEHVLALQRYGPSPLHRRSFEPVRSLGGDPFPNAGRQGVLFEG